MEHMYIEVAGRERNGSNFTFNCAKVKNYFVV